MIFAMCEHIRTWFRLVHITLLSHQLNNVMKQELQLTLPSQYRTHTYGKSYIVFMDTFETKRVQIYKVNIPAYIYTRYNWMVNKDYNLVNRQPTKEAENIIVLNQLRLTIYFTNTNNHYLERELKRPMKIVK